MYRQSKDNQSSRSRLKERRAITSSDLKPNGRDLVSMERSHGEGNLQLRNRTNVSKIVLDSTLANGISVEENSFALEFKRTSFKKASEAPIKALIEEEMSKEMEIRQPSPSVVARLMGLDTLPPPVVSKQQKEMGSSRQKTSSVGFHEKYATHEGYSLRASTNEYQEFKDVFEVVETPKVEKYNNPPVRKRMSSLKQSEIDMAFIRQKFMDAKCLSTDEAFLNSKEFNDALEVLDSNKDLFLKFLQEPNSLFKKHLHDLKCTPPSPHASHITILKPSKGTKYESRELCCKSERNAERLSHRQRGDISSYRKPATGLVSHSLKEHSCSLPHKLSESLYAGKTKGCLQSTQIVVLKPSLEKAQEAARTVPLGRSPENYRFGLRRHRETPISRTLEFYAEGRDRQKLSDSVGVMGHKTKGLREIAREITKQMRISGSSGSKKVSASKNYEYIRDESSCGMSGMENLNSELFRLTSDHLNDCNDSLSSSSYYSTELSVSREARKRLSERWKTTHQFQEVGPVCRGSSTLGEMLASDREKPRTTLNTTIIQNVSDEKMARDEVLAKWDCPLGISSKDGWKDRWSRNLLRSKSLPASPLVYGNHKPSTRNKVGGSDISYLKNVLNLSPNDPLDRNLRRRRSSSLKNFEYHHNEAQFYSGREENQMSEWEIHVNSEESQNRIHVNHLGEDMCIIPERSNNSLAGCGHRTCNFSAPRCNGAKSPLVIDDQQVQQLTELAVLAKDGDFSGHDQNVVTKETSVNHPQVNYLSHRDISESSSVSSKEADQPSPVSVLEPPPSEEDKSTSGCFEKISADLQELRMQLKILKLGSADTDAEDLEVLISSDEDNGGECHSLLKFGEILEAFRDDADRDFSYLLDLLIDSGVHGADSDGLYNACHSSEYSVGLESFEKLEKKYNVLVSWSRSERKLLFDLINSILADIVVPSIDLHPWKKSRRCQPTWAREVLVEEVWQMVVRRRKEQSGNSEEKLLELRWLDLGDDVGIVGRELEIMLYEELMEELVFELVSE